MKNEEIISIVEKFKKEYPMEGWDGDAQEFFETVDEVDLLIFFEKLYGLMTS